MLIFIKGLKTFPNEKTTSKHKKQCWKTSMGWSGHFFLQLEVGLAQVIILPPRLCVGRPILALPSTALSAQAIAASFAGVLRAVSGEFLGRQWC